MKKFTKISTAILLSATILSASATVFAADKAYTSNGMVSFEGDLGPTDPVDPNNPDPEKPVEPWDPTTPDHRPNPGTDGPLSIDFASSLDFGTNKISNKDRIYYAEPQYFFIPGTTEKDLTSARPNYVQVTDNRFVNSGWTLKVRQNHQFYNADAKYKVLAGSQIRFTNGVADSINSATLRPITTNIILDGDTGASSLVMFATVGSGARTWVDRFGDLKTMEIDGQQTLKNPAISLYVPGATPKDQANYRTVLTWTLSDVPTVE